MKTLLFTAQVLMRLGFSLAIVLGVSLTNSAQSTTATLTLPELQAAAAQRSLNVLIAERDRSVANLEVARLQADLRPQVRLDATVPSYFSSFRETVQPDGTVRFQPVNINNSSVSVSASQAFAKTGGALSLSTGLQRFDDLEQDFNLYNGSVARLRYDQPLWGYNDLKWRKQLAPARAAETKATFDLTQAQAELTATQLFFDLANAQLAYTIADSNALASKRLLEIANERYALGKVSRGDLVQLELDLASAQQRRINAGQGRRLASTAIHSFLGQTSATLLTVEVPVSPAAEDAADVDQVLAKALANRPEVLSKARRIIEAESQLEFDKRTNGFQANLSASIGLIRSDPKLAEVYRDPQLEQVAELRLSVPIVDWGRRKAIVRQSAANLALAREIGKREVRQLENDVLLAVGQYQQALAELTVLERVRELAATRYRISRESYVLGAVPLTELTLAQVARDQQQRQYLLGLQNVFVAQATLQTLTLKS